MARAHPPVHSEAPRPEEARAKVWAQTPTPQGRTRGTEGSLQA